MRNMEEGQGDRCEGWSGQEKGWVWKQKELREG
jgi:hypothetical protein